METERLGGKNVSTKRGKWEITQIQRWTQRLTLGAGGPWSSRYVDSPAKTTKHTCQDSDLQPLTP